MPGVNKLDTIYLPSEIISKIMIKKQKNGSNHKITQKINEK